MQAILEINVRIPAAQGAQAKSLEEFDRLVAAEAERLRIRDTIVFRYPDHLIPLVLEADGKQIGPEVASSLPPPLITLGVAGAAVTSGTMVAEQCSRTRRIFLRRAGRAVVAAMTLLVFGSTRAPGVRADHAWWHCNCPVRSGCVYACLRPPVVKYNVYGFHPNYGDCQDYCNTYYACGEHCTP